MEPDPVALAKQLIDELNSGNPPQLLETWIAFRLSELMEAYRGKTSQTGRMATMKKITEILIDLTRWRSMRSALHSLQQIGSAAEVVIGQRYHVYTPPDLPSNKLADSLTEIPKLAKSIEHLSFIALLRCSEDDANTILEDSDEEMVDDFQEIIEYLPTLEAELGIASPPPSGDTKCRVDSHLRKIAELIEVQRELVSKFVSSTST